MIILTIMAVASWCAMAYMLPVVWWIVRQRRRRDTAEVIQEYDMEEQSDDKL